MGRKVTRTTEKRKKKTARTFSLSLFFFLSFLARVCSQSPRVCSRKRSIYDTKVAYSMPLARKNLVCISSYYRSFAPSHLPYGPARMGTVVNSRKITENDSRRLTLSAPRQWAVRARVRARGDNFRVVSETRRRETSRGGARAPTQGSRGLVRKGETFGEAREERRGERSLAVCTRGKPHVTLAVRRLRAPSRLYPSPRHASSTVRCFCLFGRRTTDAGALI